MGGAVDRAGQPAHVVKRVRRHVGQHNRKAGREIGLQLARVGVARERIVRRPVGSHAERRLGQDPLDVPMVGDETVEPNGVAEPELRRALPQFGLERSRPDDVRRNSFTAPVQQCQRLEQQLDALSRH